MTDLHRGKPVYNFTVGTPDFKPDESVMKVVSEAALDPENYKYSLGDTDELLDAVCKWYKRRYNTVITPDEVASVFRNPGRHGSYCPCFVQPW